MWQLKGMERNADKGKRSLCLGEEGVTHFIGLFGNWKLENDILKKNKWICTYEERGSVQENIRINK